MSLRLKLALLSAALVALAVSVVTFTSSTLIGNRLDQEVDRSLVDAATRAETLVPGRGRPSRPRPAPPQGLQLGPVGVALLSDRGEVSSSFGFEVNSITDGDRALARLEGAGDPRRPGRATTGVFSTRSVESGEVRALTVPLPGTGAIVAERSLDEVRSVTGDLRRRSALVGALVVAAAAALGWWLTRRATGPLDRLRLATRELAATGQLSEPLPAAGSDEVGQLAGSFSTMVTELEASRAQQRALVEDAGHELRTPLTSLRLNLEVLARYPELPEAERAPLLADLDAEVTELSKLTNEIVELATDRHDATIPAELDLARLAERVARRARRRTGREVLVEADAVTAWGSPAQVERAMANLVDNALKFSNAGSASPTLTVRSAPVDGGGPDESAHGTVLIQVTDHGPGIPPEDLPFVFERFHRSKAARAAPGSGLGLAIVASVAAGLGGTTWARNNPNSGSTGGSTGGSTVGFSIRNH